ncbi:hypothetical protein QR680_018269 [Steinernema hermaphroditum]|uniref:Uncharacterized protein n=1 Tax=Steinernema hermaphroditum TaxID=289476 RepID=A0AA39HIC8_9BILA|nr:hypothetical protein QR680_018269 [Steinernema hermaphroditum]
MRSSLPSDTSAGRFRRAIRFLSVLTICYVLVLRMLPPKSDSWATVPSHANAIPSLSNSSCGDHVSNLVCRDANGHAVDWFITVKHAKAPSAATITSANPGNFVDEENFIEAGAVVQTILGISAHKDANVEAYSDQPPSDRKGRKVGNSNCAHAKGLYAANDKTGFHMLHNLPWGPYFTKIEKFSDPKHWFRDSSTTGGQAKGQLFLCTSLGAASMDAMVEVLNDAQVKPYYCKGNCRVQPDMSRTFQEPGIKDSLLSLGRTQLRVLYHGKPGMYTDNKGETHQKEFDTYLGVISRHNGDVYFAAQSWTKTDRAGGQPSYCARMLDDSLHCLIRIVHHGFGGQDNVTHHQDHSKLLLELPSKENYDPRWLYTLGSNAADTQMLRGAITIGLKNKEANMAFRCSLLLLDFEGYYRNKKGEEITIDEDDGKLIFRQVCASCDKDSRCTTEFKDYNVMHDKVKARRESKKK